MTFLAFPKREIGVGRIGGKIRPLGSSEHFHGGEKKHLWIHHFAYIGVKVGGEGGASHGHSHLVEERKIESVSQVSMTEAYRGVNSLFTPEITACPELPNCRRNASVSSLG